ncbi:MAG: flagellar biosynthesis anti-sigma factor FlgM [Chloroflexi bacterium]|nr:MAG: flagellar biosynthesis anti-sigma factor FlgM [Chloroflexota bacterium]
MKISDFRTAQIAQGYGVQKTGSSPDAKSKKIGGRDADATTLSPAAQALIKGRHAASEAPEVRTELVAELKRAIKDGSYVVDEYALAGKMIAQGNLSD